jgi:glutamate--cysteine ligase
MLLDSLTTRFLNDAAAIDAWFAQEEGDRRAPFYASVDIRNAGYKVAVVDTNLFPAGFNNLCDYSYRLGAEQMRAYFDRHFPNVRRILLVPESNTRIPGYISNLVRLRAMIQGAGFDVAVGTLIESVPAAGAELTGLGEDRILVQPFSVQNGTPYVGAEAYDAVVLNHDLSGGEPALIRDLTVPVIPSRLLGWHLRRKSGHFEALREITGRFASAFGLDPWEITTQFETVEGVSLDEPSPALRDAVGRVFETVSESYAQRNIRDKPYVYVKYDAGTYGMGVFPINSPDAINELPAQLRKKMRTGKGGAAINNFIIQEGLPTRDRLLDCFGEPVIYAVNNRIIGGFFRSHCDSDDRASLNRPGQIFAHLCSVPRPDQSRDVRCYHDSRLFTVYGVLTRLAGLALMAEAESAKKRAA